MAIRLPDALGDFQRYGVDAGRLYLGRAGARSWLVFGCALALACAQPPPADDPSETEDERPPRRHPNEPRDETPEDGRGWDSYWAREFAEPPDPRCTPEEHTPEQHGPVEVIWEWHYIPAYYRSSVTAIGRSLFLYRGWLRKLSMETGLYEFLTDSWGALEGMLVAGADGVLYIYCPALEAIDPDSLWLLRRISPLGSEGICVEPLILADGRVLVRSYFGYLDLFAPSEDGEAFELVWERRVSSRQPEDHRIAYSPEHDIAVVHGDGTTLGVRVADGEIVWQTDDGHNSISDILLLQDGTVITYAVHWPEGTTFEARQLVLIRRRVDTGELLDVSENLPDPGTAPHFLAAHPTGERVYLVRTYYDRDARETYVRLSAFDRDLNLLWSWRNPDPIGQEEPPDRMGNVVLTPPVVADDGSVFVSSTNCHVYRIDPDGNLVWSDRHPYPAGNAAMVLDDDGVLYALSHKSTGETGWLRATQISLIRAYRTLEPQMSEITLELD